MCLDRLLQKTVVGNLREMCGRLKIATRGNIGNKKTLVAALVRKYRVMCVDPEVQKGLLEENPVDDKVFFLFWGASIGRAIKCIIVHHEAAR